MRRTLITIAASLALLGACSADEEEFKKNAEGFIQSTQVESVLGTTFTGVTCVEPAKVETGQSFTCTGLGADGATWDFDLTITGDRAYELVGAAPRE